MTRITGVRPQKNRFIVITRGWHLFQILFPGSLTPQGSPGVQKGCLGKFPAPVTIIIAVPMMIAGIYGMNILDLPLSDKPPAFETLFGIPVMISVVMGLLMGKKKIC
jgi:hypothetical protein